MSEHAFPRYEPAPAPGVVSAAILHHLLVREPAGTGAVNIARALFGPGAGARELARVEGVLAELRADGLVEGLTGAVRPSRAARRFHAIMAGGPRG